MIAAHLNRALFHLALVGKNNWLFSHQHVRGENKTKGREQNKSLAHPMCSSCGCLIYLGGLEVACLFQWYLKGSLTLLGLGIVDRFKTMTKVFRALFAGGFICPSPTSVCGGSLIQCRSTCVTRFQRQGNAPSPCIMTMCFEKLLPNEHSIHYDWHVLKVRSPVHLLHS